MIKHHVWGYLDTTELSADGNKIKVIVDFDVDLPYQIQLRSVIHPMDFVKAFDEANNHGSSCFNGVMAYEAMYGKDWVVDRCQCTPDYIDIHVRFCSN